MRKIIFIICMVISSLSLSAQGVVTVTGFVKDASSGEVLIGATISDGSGVNGVYSDNNGYFTIHVQIPAKLSMTYVGYKVYELDVVSNENVFVNINLERSTSDLDEIVVTAKRKPTRMNVSTLSVIELSNIPSLGGKPDLAKGLQLLPGISSQGEASALLVVRGGDPGQNLYLFDNVPIIHVNHLGGFISVFNPDIINSIDVFKGGFPSKFGGKLSSIVDITQREGDISSLRGSFSIGVTDASFSIEGPTKLKKSSFIVTGRKTMIDFPMMALTHFSDLQDYTIFYGFHDINGKYTWKPNAKNSIMFNLYYGDDYLVFRQKKKARGNDDFYRPHIWGNIMGSLQWKRVLSSDVYMTNSLSYTRYRHREKVDISMNNAGEKYDYSSIDQSSVRDLSYKGDVKYNPTRNLSFDMGLNVSLLTHIPKYEEINGKQMGKDKFFSSENAIYVEGEWSFLKHSRLTAGLRGVGHFAEGFDDYSLEPRVNLSLGLSKNHSINASYMEINQYSHLIFSSGNDISTQDVWVPSGIDVPPSRSQQYTLGWQGTFAEGMFSAEASLYYKKLDNLVTFKEGYSTFSSEVGWQTALETGGKGKSKGAEILIKKEKGNFTGFIGYTLSKTTRQYPNINNGKEYLFDYDRTHVLTTSLNYKLNEKIDFNASWIYQTGLPYTPAIGMREMYDMEEGDYYEALIYGERNSGRIQDYHRLDVGMNYHTTNKRGRKVDWNFSIYNLYNRHNACYYYYNDTDKDEIYNPVYWEDGIHSLKLYKMSVFPIIPTVSYKLYFSPDDPPKQKKHRTIGSWLRFE